MQYFSFGADADINGNGNIDDAEYAHMSPFNNWYVPSIVSRWAATDLYRLIGEVASTKIVTKKITTIVVNRGEEIEVTKDVKVIEETPNTSFQPNDLAVTVNSAKHPKFTFLGQKASNHSFIGNANVAGEVINKLRSINPVNE